MERIRRSLQRLFRVNAIVIFVLISCSSVLVLPSEEQRREYGLLLSAVTFSSDKVIGEYDDAIPKNFDEAKFMDLIKDKIPEDYYDALKRYKIFVEPKGSYYLLLIRNPESNAVILFDYSCTPEADGPILLEPGKYDLNNLDLYDTCKTLE